MGLQHTLCVCVLFFVCGCLYGDLCIKENVLKLNFFVCRTWTRQARAHPVRTAPSSLETRRPQHRTTTRRKGSRCYLMVRPLSQSYHSNSTETSLLNGTTWVRQLSSLPRCSLSNRVQRMFPSACLWSSPENELLGVCSPKVYCGARRSDDS